jgi:glycosyltransferase involved in cell wall biosynthesis
MTRRLAFYAPLKPVDHPVPSGDRRMARSLVATLRLAGFTVEIPSRLRSYDRSGDPTHQHRIATLGARIAGNLVRRFEADRAAQPEAWLTYHVYHKSPDWLGPVVAPALAIPYLIVEASHAAKRVEGRHAFNHRGAEHAIRLADVVLALTGVDALGLAPLITAPAELRRLPPFLDPAPYLAAAASREAHRADLADRFSLDPARPWLLAVGMMRADAKLESYRLLAEALAQVRNPHQLLIIGDGPARGEVEAAFERLGVGVVFAGEQRPEVLAAAYAAADLMVWPAVREAYGLAMLEAQAAGCPVVAGDEGGVREVVQDGISGILVPARSPGALAAAVDGLLRDRTRRSAMGAAAQTYVRRERSQARAAVLLAAAIEAAAAIRLARS